MAINWEDLQSVLLDLALRDITAFANAHQHETYYGFMFDCNSDYGQVLLCLNTEASLQNQAESYKRDYKDLYADKTVSQIRDSLRWNAGDWEHQGINSRDFDAAWQPFESAVLDACMCEVEDEKTFMAPTQEEFMRSVCRVLVQLERVGTFDCLATTDDFKTFVADHDELESESWERLTLVRDLVGQ